jgi:outer membrane protein assembly factor BamB
MTYLRLTGLAIWICFSSSMSLRADDWPTWRGPTGMGQTNDPKLPIVWGGKEEKNILWKVALPGANAQSSLDQNQSSPIVSRGRVFVTGSYWPEKTDPKQIPEHHVACYRAEDGKLLWDKKIDPGPWLFSDLRGGYTAPTPLADQERVYVVFGSAVIASLDYEGNLVWRKEIKPHKFDVALAASPILFEEMVILQCDQVDKQSRIIAYDRKTGETKWEQNRPSVNFGHSTPVLTKIGDKFQLLVSASNALQGLDPSNGKILWWCSAQGDTVSPVRSENLVYIDSGRGGYGVAVDPTGTGDVTKTHLKWKVSQIPEGISSPVTSGDYLYRLHRPDVLKCIQLKTGEILYSERLNKVSTWSSPIATSNGKIYLASAGKSYVIESGPKLKIVATNDLNDESPASPAVSNNCLFLKGRKMLYCIASKE